MGDGTLHYFWYDPVGNLSRTVDARGGAYFAYDKVNRMVTDDEPIVGTMYSEYDAVGNHSQVYCFAYDYDAAVNRKPGFQPLPAENRLLDKR